MMVSLPQGGGRSFKSLRALDVSTSESKKGKPTRNRGNAYNTSGRNRDVSSAKEAEFVDHETDHSKGEYYKKCEERIERLLFFYLPIQPPSTGRTAP
jgi:hypothetical protein